MSTNFTSLWGNLSNSRGLRWVVRAFLGVGGLVSILLLATYFWLNSGPGRAFLVRTIQDQVNRPGELELRIGSLEGSVLSRFQVTDITISDRDGAWLRMKSAEIAWEPTALWSRQLVIIDFEVSNLSLDRLPIADDDEEHNAGFDFPRFPLAVRLNSLQAADINLGPAVLGEAMRFKLAASATTTEDQGQQAALELERTDGSSDRISGRAGFDPTSEQIELSLQVAESTGGPLARLLELPGYPAITADLSGLGPRHNWNGQLTAEAEGMAKLSATVKIDATGPLRVNMAGRSHLQSRPENPGAAVLGDVQQFDIEAVWHGVTESLAIPRLLLESDAIRLTGNGEIALGEDRISANVALGAKNIAPITQISDPLGFTGLKADIQFDGALSNPKISLRGTVTAPKLNDLHAASADVKLTLAPDRPLTDGHMPLPIKAQLELADFSTSIAEIDAFLAKKSMVTLSGALDPQTLTIVAQALEAKNGTLTLTANGRLDVDQVSGDVAGILALPTLSPLSQPLGFPIQGQADINFSLQSDDFEQGLSAELSADVTHLGTDLVGINALLGPDSAVMGTVDLDANKISISGVKLEGTALILRGNLEAPRAFDTVDATFVGEIKDLSTMSENLGVGLAGKVTFDGRLKGPLGDPRLEGTASSTAVKVHGQTLEAVSMDYAVASLREDPQGYLDAKAQSAYGAFSAHSDYRLTGDRLNLTGFSLAGNGSKVTGTVSVPFSAPILSAKFNGEVTDLAPWSDVLGSDIAGSASFDVLLKNAGKSQGAELDLTAQKLATQGLYTEKLFVTSSIQDLFDLPRGQVEIKGQGFEFTGGSLTDFSVAAEGNLTDVTMVANGVGDVAGPLELVSRGRVRVNNNTREIILTTLEGKLANYPLRLQRPLEISLSPNRFELVDLDLTYHGGTLKGDLGRTERSITSKLEFSKIPLELAALVIPGPELTGELDATLELNGLADSPEGSFKIVAHGIGLTGSASQDAPKAALKLDGTLGDARLGVAGDVSGFGDNSLLLNADIPLRFSLTDFQAELPKTEKLSANLSFDGALRPITEILLPHTHQLSGDANVDLQLTGTFEKPLVTGSAAVSETSYENLDSGTVFNNIVLMAEANGPLVTITELSAGESDKRQVTGTGTIQLDSDQDIPVALQIVFNEALLISRDDIEATVNGELKIGGRLNDALIEGQIRSSTVELRLVDALPVELVGMEVIEINREDGQDHAPKKPTTSKPSILRLDVALNLPRRIFVRGRGLDSEWSGDLKISGTADTPRIEGQLKPVRGRFSFAGKILKLERGTITFDGGGDLDPLLDLSLVYSKSDFKAIILITGTASDPDIELTSEPPLPDDEILAKILFDKSTGQLTGLEALKMVSAVATLSGSGPSGAGFLDKFRNKLGVDVLRVDAGANGDGTSFTVGNYVADGVYVGVGRGTEKQSTNATVELEVTSKITVETNVGQNKKRNVGVKWKWDY